MVILQLLDYKSVSKDHQNPFSHHQTKTDQGEQDENISIEQSEELVSGEVCHNIDIKT